MWYLKQPVRWNYMAGFALMVAAVAVIFKKWGSSHYFRARAWAFFNRAICPAW